MVVGGAAAAVVAGATGAAAAGTSLGNGGSSAPRAAMTTPKIIATTTTPKITNQPRLSVSRFSVMNVIEGRPSLGGDVLIVGLYGLEAERGVQDGPVRSVSGILTRDAGLSGYGL